MILDQNFRKFRKILDWVQILSLLKFVQAANESQRLHLIWFVEPRDNLFGTDLIQVRNWISDSQTMFAQVQARPGPNRTPSPTLRMTEGFLEDFIIVNPIEVDLMLCANFVIYQKLIRSSSSFHQEHIS